jgi:GAF domain-containing protein
MQTIGAKMGAHLDLSLVTFAEIDEAAEQAVVTHDWHREGVPGVVGVYKLAEYVTEHFRTAVRSGEVFVVRDTATDPRTNPERHAALKVRAVVCVPLVREDQSRFSLNVHDSKPRNWPRRKSRSWGRSNLHRKLAADCRP